MRLTVLATLPSLFLCSCVPDKWSSGVAAGVYTIDCTGWATATGSHLGYGGYLDSTATSGDECACSGSFDGGDAAYYVNDASFNGTSTEPYRIGTDAPGSDLDETGRNPNPGWTADLSPTTSSPHNLTGTYDGFVSLKDKDENALECTENSAGFMLDIRDAEGDAAEPTPPPSDDSHECDSPGTRSATRFRLFPHPGGVYRGVGREAVPVYRMGSTRFGSLGTYSLQVLDFAGADAILVSAGPTLLATLTPGAGTAILGGEVFGELTLAVVDNELTAGRPEVRLVGDCVTTGDVVTRPQGYRMTSAAFNAAFGVSADATARVQDTDTGGRTLMIEVPGTTLHMGFPLVSTGGANYTLDFEGFDFEVHGTVVHGTSVLAVTVTSGWVGSVAIPAGTYNFPAL